MKFMLAAVMLLLLAVAPGAPAVTARANKAEFSALCGLVQLCRSELTVPELSGAASTSYEHILDFNMTTSDDDWRKLFRNDSEPSKYHESKPKEITAPAEWDANWKEWLAAAKNADRPDEKQHIKQSKLHLLSANDKKSANFIVRQLAREASAWLSSLTENPTTTAALQKTALTTTMKEVLYGEATAAPTTVTTQQAFKKRTAATAGDCKKGTEDGGPISLYATLACVCGHDQDSGVTGLCADKQTASNDWQTGGKTLADDKMRNIADLCPAGSNTELTTTTLTGLLNAVKSLITIHSNDGFLGAVVSDCDGTGTNGACVKYPNYKTTPTELKKVKWLEKLETLNVALREREELIAREKLVVSMLQAAEGKAQSLGTHPPPALAATQLNTAALPHIDTKQQSKDCTAHKDNKKACTDANCKWEPKDGKSETQGECKPKEGEGTTNAVGDGDGAKEGTAASSGCAQHFNDKDKCEKMNEGKEKPVCAWKKGGENDKDKDELRCRNGSFLVNNQFALSVVSAAFVALLF
uniref:Variant surface glycoprotein n=2 Tax=Trypanosoma brucei TaxID=5691 RepID=A5JS52_9TRYP|nr:variant surface glycoprotein [Trypanosoma brucei]